LFTSFQVLTDGAKRRCPNSRGQATHEDDLGQPAGTFGAHRGVRTHDHKVKRLVLYQTMLVLSRWIAPHVERLKRNLICHISGAKNVASDAQRASRQTDQRNVTSARMPRRYWGEALVFSLKQVSAQDWGACVPSRPRALTKVKVNVRWGPSRDPRKKVNELTA